MRAMQIRLVAVNGAIWKVTWRYIPTDHSTEGRTLSGERECVLLVCAGRIRASMS